MLMLNNLLGIFEYMSPLDALIYSVIGFVVVFIGICVIIFCIWLFGLIMTKVTKSEKIAKFVADRKANKAKKAELKALKKAQNSIDKNIEQNDVQNISGDVSLDIKVAIVAAISAYYFNQSEQVSPAEFKVKRIKRF